MLKLKASELTKSASVNRSTNILHSKKPYENPAVNWTVGYY